MSAIRSHGFTLVELMVTVIILSIIVAIAYPAYTKYTTRTRRSDAQVALTQTSHRLEKYFSTCNQYPSAAGPAAISNPWPGDTVPSCLGAPGENGSQGIGRRGITHLA
jgi:prepilin-type N-terminal cleavage/methylation domain-containing protein